MIHPMIPQAAPPEPNLEQRARTSSSAKDRARRERMMRAWNEKREISHRTFGLIIEDTVRRHPRILDGPDGLFKGIVLPEVSLVPDDYHLPSDVGRLLHCRYAIDCARHYLGTPHGWGTLEDERTLFRNGIRLTGYPLFPFEVGRLAKDSKRMSAVAANFAKVTGPYTGFVLTSESINAHLNGVFDMIPRREGSAFYDFLVRPVANLLPFTDAGTHVVIDIHYFKDDASGIHYVPDIVGDLYTLGVLVSALELTFGREDIRVRQLRSPFSREVEAVKLLLPEREGVAYSYDGCEFETGQFHTYRLEWKGKTPFTVFVESGLGKLTARVERYNLRHHPEFVEGRTTSLLEAGEAAQRAEATADEATARALSEMRKRAEEAERYNLELKEAYAKLEESYKKVKEALAEIAQLLYMQDHEVMGETQLAQNALGRALTMVQSLTEGQTSLETGIAELIEKTGAFPDPTIVDPILDKLVNGYEKLKTVLKAPEKSQGPSSIEEEIEAALRRIRYMSGSLRSIKYYVKFDAGRLNFNGATRDMIEMLTEEVELHNADRASQRKTLGPTFGSPPIALQIDSDYGGPLYAPKDGLQMIMYNLVRNSGQLDTTGIDLAVSGTDGQVQVTYRDYTQSPMDDLTARAWELGEAKPNQDSRLGMGNRLTYRVLQACDASLQIQPETDGTRFIFTFKK